MSPLPCIPPLHLLEIPYDEKCSSDIYEMYSPMWPYILLKCKYLHFLSKWLLRHSCWQIQQVFAHNPFISYWFQLTPAAIYRAKRLVTTSVSLHTQSLHTQTGLQCLTVQELLNKRVCFIDIWCTSLTFVWGLKLE